MSYIIYTDSFANLPGDQVRRHNIRLLPCHYLMDHEQKVYDGDLDAFDFHAYYQKLARGSVVKTTLINAQAFTDAFAPVLEQGQDVVYVGLSSGVSGTLQSARIAAEELMEQFPGRTVRVVDSLGAGLGTGLLVLRAADLAAQGLTASEAGDILDREVMHTLNFFTVEDLNFLKRTGRVSGATAAIGTVLNIKPILWGDPDGHITALSKVRGRKKSLDALVELYKSHVREDGVDRLAISHGDCLEDARLLADKLCAVCQPREQINVPHEPFAGSPVGPGMLAFFFQGKHR